MISNFRFLILELRKFCTNKVVTLSDELLGTYLSFRG